MNKKLAKFIERILTNPNKPTIYGLSFKKIAIGRSSTNPGREISDATVYNTVNGIITRYPSGEVINIDMSNIRKRIVFRCRNVDKQNIMTEIINALGNEICEIAWT